MQPTNEQIVLSCLAKTVQEAWDPKIDDLCITFIGKNAHPFRTSYKTFQASAKHHIKKMYTFLPDAKWCAQKIAESGKLKGIRSYQKGKRWVISISIKETFKPKDMILFNHADYNTVHLIAVEFVLSGGKNDLREVK